MMKEKFEPTWSSLKRHRHPEWLDDAKYGIYFHWGIYSVPAFGSEWYPNRMYTLFTPEFSHHVNKYGLPKDFGYKDFIPDFTAEHFDAGAWAALFKEAGARFAGPVAEHHDGFSLWDSKINKWNSVNMGPRRDIVKELATAIRDEGMKFICTFHHAQNWYYYNHSTGLDTGQPEFEGLYGKPHAAVDGEGTSNNTMDRPDFEFNETWFAKLKEVIDGYEPDLIWFDFGLERIHDTYKRQLAAYYYNKGMEWGKEVEIIYKNFNMPPGVGLLDYERGRSDALTHHKWITDTSIGNRSWSYIENEDYKAVKTLVHNFVDRISKNGYLLLNFGPKADGTIPPAVIERLKGMGAWIKLNSEGIFGSTPWVLSGEGPTTLEGGGMFSENAEVAYTERDIRFVTKDNALFAFVMGWPLDGALNIKSLTLPPVYENREERPGKFYILEPADIASISMLGHQGNLEWDLTARGLFIQLPASPGPCKHAYGFKIQWT
ncbi:alpha-L-fucosidase [Candidatus Bathyarchaeota archaeon]|nr:alpha-L-fucosidase [Candidatus Bathyarchaeota archaeon]